jgi:hypothetical protein
MINSGRKIYGKLVLIVESSELYMLSFLAHLSEIMDSIPENSPLVLFNFFLSKRTEDNYHLATTER